MLGMSKNLRHSSVLVNTDICGKPLSIMTATVSMHIEVPSALIRTGQPIRVQERHLFGVNKVTRAPRTESTEDGACLRCG